MIGYDSYSVKQEHVQENPWRPLIVLSVLEAACQQYADCEVCHEPLGPLTEDKNHHASLNDGVVGDRVLHYCAAHCPACNRSVEDDDHL